MDELALDKLLAHLEPRLRPGRYVFASAIEVPEDAEAVVTVQEDEGVTLVLDQAQADRLGLAYDYVAAWITLQVDSALDAVGLTAAFATALAGAGLSCNVVAGYHHDHIFVPHEEGERAIEVLRGLSAGGR